MKLYTSVGPNPRVINMFLAELGMDVERVEIDIMAGENLNEEYKTLNPSAQSPCLILDSGLVLAEITAICGYFDEVSDAPSLIGDTPEQRAETRMWSRRADVRILEPMSLGFRSAEGLPIFENRCHVIPHAADDLKATVQENWVWLDSQLAGNDYLCGDRFTMADVQLFCFAEFGAAIGQGVPAELANLQAWMARIATRESAVATAG